MADDADRASKIEDMERETLTRRKREDLDPGTQGECDLCGEWFSRLVHGACGRCRDKYRLR